VLHSPGFGAEVAGFLAAERPQVRAIGLDTASLDVGASSDYPAHVAWLPGGRYGIENLANLEKVPETGAMLFVARRHYWGEAAGRRASWHFISRQSSVLSRQLRGRRPLRPSL